MPFGASHAVAAALPRRLQLNDMVFGSWGDFTLVLLAVFVPVYIGGGLLYGPPRPPVQA
jgi:hypothetical protein